MVLTEINKDQASSKPNKKTLTIGKFNFDVSVAKLSRDETSPSIYTSDTFKVSKIPQQGDRELLRLSQAQILKNAYDIYLEAHDLEDNYAEDVNSFFCEGQTINPSPSGLGASSIKVGTDCSGIDVPIIALNESGISFVHKFSSDNDPKAQETIQANSEPEFLYDDVQNRDNDKVPYVDLYVAGFPCQPFSTMGKQQGFEDDQGRGTIFFDILDYIRTKLPKVFILENVKGLVTLDKGKHMNKVLKLLRQIRLRDDDTKAYDVKWKLMNTKELGIPHSRPRWYCVGIRKDTLKP